MKKFTKLAAVLAALVLALSCFVGCSSGDDDDDAGVSVLEGYWMYENTLTTSGWYFVGNKVYNVTNGNYVEQAGLTFSISGNDVIANGQTLFTFSISEDGKTLTIEHLDYKKQSGTPKKM